MYWNSKLIREKLDQWCILAIRQDGQIYCYILIMLAMDEPGQVEIFDAEAATTEDCRRLISAGAGYAWDAGCDEILFMPDVGSPELEAALATGFKIVGSYQGYRAVIGSK